MVTKGSIVRVDFDAFTSEGELFDTTSPDVAKKADAFNEEIQYGPLALVVGAGRVVPGFDAALEAAEIGKTVEVTLTPEEGFGPRDPAKVTTVPMREFEKQDMHPHPGMRLNYKGKRATITNVGAGRVRLDMNPPFAGKSLKYTFTIRDEITDPAERIAALIDGAYGPDKSAGFDISVEGDVATLKVPDSCKYDQNWFVAKYRVVSDLRNYAEIKTTRFVEEYLTEEDPMASVPDDEAAAADEQQQQQQ